MQAASLGRQTRPRRVRTPLSRPPPILAHGPHSRNDADTSSSTTARQPTLRSVPGRESSLPALRHGRDSGLLRGLDRRACPSGGVARSPFQLSSRRRAETTLRGSGAPGVPNRHLRSIDRHSRTGRHATASALAPRVSRALPPGARRARHLKGGRGELTHLCHAAGTRNRRHLKRVGAEALPRAPTAGVPASPAGHACAGRPEARSPRLGPLTAARRPRRPRRIRPGRPGGAPNGRSPRTC
jgi:hypothetical protein